MNILVTGSNGQLGLEIQKVKEENSNINWYFVPHEVLDITKFSDVKDYVKQNNIDIIINCAAYTHFDKCYEFPDKATLINSFGPMILSKVAEEFNCLLIHISSDYVFDGEKIDGEYEVNDEPKPISFYGKSKYLGEKFIELSNCDYLIFRTSWLYGGEKRNFVDTMFSKIEKEDIIKVVSDQTGTPTYVTDLANFLVGIINNFNLDYLRKNKGIYHFANKGKTTWFDITQKIYLMRIAEDINFNHKCKIIPISTDDFPSKDKRPKYSPLSTKQTEKVFKYGPKNWEDSLNDCVLKYIKNGKQD